MMVVPVLITSCQVSLYLKNGPLTSQTRISATEIKNVVGRPLTQAIPRAKRSNHAEVPFPLRLAGECCFPLTCLLVACAVAMSVLRRTATQSSCHDATAIFALP